jgi:2-methylcitrate dehydratase PrpD
LGIAASSAAGLRANSGTMTKALHAGMANRNGLQAALLAEAGFTANPGVLEHRFGFMAAFNGGIAEGRPAALDGWGEDFALLSPGIAIKQYPCCAFVHCAIDAAVALRREIAGRPVVAVRVELHGKRLKNIDRPEPHSGLDAKFSTQYLTARALLDGGVGLGDFEDSRIADPRARTLAGRVTLAAHDAADLSLGRVQVTLDDGEVLSAEASVAMGRGPANPMTPAEFRAKFDDCVGRMLPVAAGAQLYQSLTALPELTSIRSLTALTAAPRTGRAPFAAVRDTSTRS